MSRAAAGALLRIAGVLGLLVLVAVVVGVLQVAGWSPAWGFYGPLVGSGLLWCVVIWRDRHRGPVVSELAHEAAALLARLEQERATPAERRPSGCGDDSLVAAQDLAEQARDGTAEAALAIQARARREQWRLASPVREQVEVLAAAAERHLARDQRRPRWWQWSMTRPR